MGAIFSALAARFAVALANGLAAILGRVFDALRGKRQDQDRVATHERASVAEAAQETGEIIAEIADERSALPGAGDDPDDLARRLRGRKSAAAGSGLYDPNHPGAGHAGGA